MHWAQIRFPFYLPLSIPVVCNLLLCPSSSLYFLLLILFVIAPPPPPSDIVISGFSLLADGSIAAGVQWNTSINASIGTNYEIEYSNEVTNLAVDLNNTLVSHNIASNNFYIHPFFFDLVSCGNRLLQVAVMQD